MPRPGGAKDGGSEPVDEFRHVLGGIRGTTAIEINHADRLATQEDMDWPKLTVDLYHLPVLATRSECAQAVDQHSELFQLWRVRGRGLLQPV